MRRLVDVSPCRKIARLDGVIDATLRKEFDLVKAFNRALTVNRWLRVADIAEYVTAYEAAYTAECDAMRKRGAL